jgi:hypothetical protein
MKESLAFANLAGAYATSKEGGTKTFAIAVHLPVFMCQQGAPWTGARCPSKDCETPFRFETRYSG